MPNPNFLPSGHKLHQRYFIQSSIGQGGFGITYLAYDQKLDQEVCIKELFISGNSTRGANQKVSSQDMGEFSFSDFVERFIQECRKLARFQHPNIVRVLDIFQDNCTAYIVMEYIRGETLKQKIQRTGPMNEKAAISLISQLLDAVEEVHNRRMLHRDIKPDNVLITPEGKLVLIDFGSAREFAEGKTTTQTAMLTPGFAPIEQYSTRAQRGSYTDIYALGATLYFLLTGEKPIPVTDRVAEDLIPPHKINPEISTQVSSAVMLAMEMKPENRFQSVDEIREAITMLQNIADKKENQVKQKPEVSPRNQSYTTKNEDNSWKYFMLAAFVLIFGFLFFKSDILKSISKQSHLPMAIQKLNDDMVQIDGGSFLMGCTSEQINDCYSDEKPVHNVTLSSFFISKYEVTQAQWNEVMGSNPNFIKNCDHCPVDQVSWENVQIFLRKLNNLTGKKFRLPTEAEWEYSARGGRKTKKYLFSGSNDPNEVGWWKNNSSITTKLVGQKKPNELGLYDMSGNVWEWCSDYYSWYDPQNQTNPIINNSLFPERRVIRGGSIFNFSRETRVSHRRFLSINKESTTEFVDKIGFRLVLDEVQ